MEHSMVTSWVGILGMVVFVISYIAIAMGEQIKINKAKPALFAGTLIFIMIGIYYHANSMDINHLLKELEHLILEIVELFFFLFVAMTYVETLVERNVFNTLKYNLIQKGYSYKKLFWITGLLAFFLSPIVDNLTTALILSTVLLTLEKDNKTFLILGAINIVVAANAGGVWSPFGDVTTLMIWAAGKGAFMEFLFLFPASFIGWALTAFLLSMSIPEGTPVATDNKKEFIKRGGKVVMGLGIFTIVVAVLSHQILHLPTFWGMMFGLSVLQIYSSFLKRKESETINIFQIISKIESDTLLFFFGLTAAVGALGVIGYLAIAANVYNFVEHTTVNTCVGLLSAIAGNVPTVFAVLKSNPAMDSAQWMLVTLTAGIGGSLISFGSAAGVGVMGKIRGVYTFGAHMKYVWAIALGYFASVAIWYVQFEVLGLH